MRSASIRLQFGWAVVFLALCALAPTAHAVSQRTFVASTGSDVNPCSVALPCRSFAAAMAQTAVDGELIVLDSAGYGPVAIAQSVSIISPPGIHAGITVTAGDGVSITVSNVVVTLKGLNIIGQGGTHGVIVNVTNAHVLAEDLSVTGMAGYGVYVSGGSVMAIRRAVLAGNNRGAGADGGASLLMDDAQIVRNIQVGAEVRGGASATISRSMIAGNGLTGVSVAYPGAATQLSVDNSVIVDNGGAGSYVESNGAGGETRASFARSTIARNFGDGIAVKGDQTSVTYVSALGNVIEGNAADGIAAACFNNGRAVANAAANMVTRNNYAGLSATAVPPGNCIMRTIGNNMVRETNSGPNLSNVTKVAGD